VSSPFVLNVTFKKKCTAHTVNLAQDNGFQTRNPKSYFFYTALQHGNQAI
jgi:hypothetical protein